MVLTGAAGTAMLAILLLLLDAPGRFLTLSSPETTQRFPKRVLTSCRQVDKCLNSWLGCKLERVLNAPDFSSLKLKYVNMLSSFAFKSYLRRSIFVTRGSIENKHSTDFVFRRTESARLEHPP